MALRVGTVGHCVACSDPGAWHSDLAFPPPCRPNCTGLEGCSSDTGTMTSTTALRTHAAAQLQGSFGKYTSHPVLEE